MNSDLAIHCLCCEKVVTFQDLQSITGSEHLCGNCKKLSPKEYLFALTVSRRIKEVR